MGSAASCSRQSDTSEETPNATDQQKKNNRQVLKVHALMSSLRHDLLNDNNQNATQSKKPHIIDMPETPFTIQRSVECGDILEFKINGISKYDIFQVYKNGADYYRLYHHDEGCPMYHGYELFNIRACTSENKKRMLLSFTLNPDQSHLDIYLCVIRSSKRRKIFKERICPRNQCGFIKLEIKEHIEKITLTDQNNRAQIYLYEGDTIDLERLSENGTRYLIEEKKFCLISGGLYTVAPTSRTSLTQRNYRKTFDEYGMSFLFCYDDTDDPGGVTVCIVNKKYRIRNVQITDDDINPNIIQIEQNDWILFEWDSEHELAIEQIDPCQINQHSNRMRNVGEHFFWPYERTCHGCMYHRFIEPGIYHYNTRNNRIGTIIVKPKRKIHPVTLFNDKLIYDMETKDFVQFNWKRTDPLIESKLITIDSHTSVLSKEDNEQPEISDPCEHGCSRPEALFRSLFLTCETLLFDVSRYGLYNIIYSENPKNSLISLIVKKTSDWHDVTYDDETGFESNLIKINCFDQVQFRFSSRNRRTIRICQTDKDGNSLESEDNLFQTQENSINYLLREFSESGIYYYSISIENHDRRRSKTSETALLTILVLPQIRFHYKFIHKNIFDDKIVFVTNRNDFVIWEFDKAICHNVIKLKRNETFDELLSCDSRGIVGRNRRCLAVYCKQLPHGASFFANPDFQWVTEIYEERLISTVIVDPPFNQYSFLITDRQFIPDILYIPENETVSWTSMDNTRNHHISVKSNEDDHQVNERDLLDRNIALNLNGVDYLHTFNQTGEYRIQSNCFKQTATVVVYPKTVSRKNRITKPEIKEKIEPITQLGSQVHIECPDNHNATIYYTFSGLPPTKHTDNVYSYDPDEGAHFFQLGLQVLRCYATIDRKLPSPIIHSRPTFVMGDEDFTLVWNRIHIIPTASHKPPSLIYGKINIKPRYAFGLIDHFTLHTNDIKEGSIPLAKKVNFSVNVFPPGNQSEIYITAHPKADLPDAIPILSHKLTFKYPADGTERHSPPTSSPSTEDDANARARKLLEKLKKSIERRRIRLESINIHPHTVYPGTDHYMDNRPIVRISET